MVDRALLFVIFIFSSTVHAQLQWKGDIRVRAMHEKDGDNSAHWDGKLRARLGFTYEVDPELRMEFRLSTARGHRDQDQMLGENSAPGSARRFFGLDLAFADWSPLAFLHLYAGRIPQIHFRPGGSQIILDEDIALEGAGFTVEHTFAGVRVFGNGGSVIIRQNYDPWFLTAETDNMINWAQAGLEWKNDLARVIGGFGFYNFVSVKGVLFSDLSAGGLANGNSDKAGEVKYPYLPKQYFVEGTIKSGELAWTIFGERVINNETHEKNAAWWGGLRVQQEARWDVALAYAELQADAVLSLFTDSEFGGGRTDAHGYIGSFGWKFSPRLGFRVTEYLAETSGNRIPKEYHRTNIDVTAEF